MKTPLAVLFFATLCMFTAGPLAPPPALAASKEAVRIKDVTQNLERWAKLGKPLICTYQGKPYKVVGYTPHLVVYGGIVNLYNITLIHLSVGDGPFFTVRADWVENIRPAGK